MFGGGGSVVTGAPAETVETAGDVAERELRGLVRTAIWDLKRLLRTDGLKPGLTDEELSGHTSAWRLRLQAAELTLKLALSTRARRTSVRRKASGADDAADEPDDDSGIPADFLSHLR